jgi:hypothetical protein
MIAQHHEAADGSGWPNRTKDSEHRCPHTGHVQPLRPLVRPRVAQTCRPLMPSEALAYMLRQEASKYDTQMLAALIKLLGVYPPGHRHQTQRRHSLALVVSPGADIQRPRVLLYAPDAGDADAPLLDLAKPELKVTEAIRPASLAPKCCNGSTPKNVWPVSFQADDA